jgi:hypothetical protein
MNEGKLVYVMAITVDAVARHVHKSQNRRYTT